MECWFWIQSIYKPETCQQCNISNNNFSGLVTPCHLLDLTQYFCDIGESMRSSSQRTTLLHSTRFLANRSAYSILISRRWKSSLTLSSHRFFGLPTSLLPWPLPYIMMFGMLEDCMRATCHLNCVLSHSLNVMVCTINLKYYEILQFNFCCFDLSTFGQYNFW